MTIDKATALAALMLAEAAYGVDSIEPAVPAGFYLVGAIRSDAQLGGNPFFGFVVHDGKTCFIVLRGTESAGEWLADFDAELVDVGGFHVHRGFQRVFESLQQSIRYSVEANAQPACDALPVCVIGHSLGAAVAQLVAHSIGAQACIVFASPRVGDEAWKARLEAAVPSILRVTNTKDIVTHVPPRPAFTHAGKAVAFDGWANARDLAQRLDAHFEHSLEQSYGPGVRGMPDALQLIELS